MTTRPLIAVLLMLALLTASAPARAAERRSEVDESGAIWWVLTVGEYSLLVGSALIGAAVAVAGGGNGGNVGGLLFGTALVLGIGAGFESIDKKWDPHIAIALHDALWLGADLAALGVLLAVPVLQWPLYGTIPLALALGLAGAAGGAAVGGLLRDSVFKTTIAYLAPLVGAGAVGLVWLTASTWRQPPLDPAIDPLFATALWTGFTLPLLASALAAAVLPAESDR